MASCEAGGLGNTVDGHFVSFFIAGDGSKSMREGRERGKTDVRKWNEPTFKKKKQNGLDQLKLRHHVCDITQSLSHT